MAELAERVASDRRVFILGSEVRVTWRPACFRIIRVRLRVRVSLTVLCISAFVALLLFVLDAVYTATLDLASVGIFLLWYLL